MTGFLKRWRGLHNATENKFIFFGYLEKQDDLIKGWLNWEIWIVVVLCFAALICVADPTNWALLAWIPLYALVTITIAVVGTCKTVQFYKIAKRSSVVVSHHKDPYLKSIFFKSPSYLKIIIILDIFFPVLWIFSFLVKLLFAVNAQKMKELITITTES